MTFIQRFLSLARADAHGVLDSLEDSSLMLRQCLREAELELAQKRQRRDELGRWGEQLERLRETNSTRIRELDTDIVLALQQGQEDLARFAIRRQLAARKRSQAVAEQLTRAREERAGLAGELETQERELTELRERVQIHLAEERTRRQFSDAEVEGSGENSTTLYDPVHEEEVELELLRRRGAEVPA